MRSAGSVAAIKIEQSQYNIFRELAKCCDKSEMSIKFAQAVDFITKAQKFDDRQCYREAIGLYESGVRHFMDALKDEIEGEIAKSAIAEKCQQYAERAQELRQCVAESESGRPDNCVWGATPAVSSK